MRCRLLHRYLSDIAKTEELGQIIFNLCHIVPGGLIVFFPSYSYLKVAKDVWTPQLLDKLGVKKKVYYNVQHMQTYMLTACPMQVFMEPQSSSDVEKVLHEYAAAARCQDLV